MLQDLRALMLPLRPWLALLFPVSLLLSPCAHALDRFEIQVYDDDVAQPGQFGLEVHGNYTVLGHRTGDYPGAVPAHQAARLTFEPAIGVTDWLEFGAYLQFVVQPDAGARYGGVKLRAKFVVPERVHLPVHLGINVEIGRVPADVEENGWANEFRPILGWTNRVWSASFNPIFGYALTGADRFKPEFEPCGKVSWNTQHGFAVGLEYYAGLGLLSQGFAALGQQEHMAFAVFDLAAPKEAKEDPKAWELNAAIGRGLTSGTAQEWVVKTIVGKPF